jgi:hypothetical protein
LLYHKPSLFLTLKWQGIFILQAKTISEISPSAFFSFGQLCLKGKCYKHDFFVYFLSVVTVITILNLCL